MSALRLKFSFARRSSQNRHAPECPMRWVKLCLHAGCNNLAPASQRLEEGVDGILTRVPRRATT
ncbi:MAG: hypothetical protein H0X52_07780 [Gemmatimonadetes bacterium]|nr:hypothetical protein [Gemmatimonadota bacterium]